MAVWDYLFQIGLGTPLARAVTFGALGLLPIFFQTRLSYYPTGGEGAHQIWLAKKFSLLTTDAETPREQQTYIHFIFWPILFAIFGGLFL